MKTTLSIVAAQRDALLPKLLSGERVKETYA